MANIKNCRPKRYAAQRAQTFFGQDQTSALFYKEQNDLKKALRRSLIEARRAASRVDRVESDSKYADDGDTVEKESDQSDQARPKRYAALRAQILFSQEQTSVLFYKEQNDLKKALRKSLLEAKRAANRADRSDGSNKYVNGVYKVDKSRSEDSESHEHPDDDQHSNKDSRSNDSTSSKSKKLKIHAQRKFASSSVNNIAASSPVKSASKNYNTVAELFPRHRPSTEDFLTFLCFRSTKLLPPINGSYNCTD